MKIAYLAAGAGGMYCGSCLHDNTLAAALVELGEEALLIPTYTPLRTDEPNVSQRRLFFGGINVYLQQKLPLFRRTPRFLDWIFDRPALVSWLAGYGASTDPARLGGLTVSMLRGEEGHQAKELEKLVRWLADVARPDVVHLSNVMLLGMARRIARATGAPVVCSLSGEDIFLDKLDRPSREAAHRILRERAGDVAAFVALNRYYAGYMAGCLGIDAGQIEVIPHGMNLAGHGQRPPGRRPEVTIGYFARICHDKGLHLLAEAFAILSRDAALPPLRLRAAGYLGPADRGYLAAVERRLAAAGLSDRYAYAGELDRPGKIAFLESLDVMSVPTVYRESKGLSALEALANGVPLVLPEHGAFPELIQDTAGGLLCRPEDPADLAEKLKQLIQDPDLADRLGRQGRSAVRERYHAQGMARQTAALYRRLLARPVSGQSPQAPPAPLAGRR